MSGKKLQDKVVIIGGRAKNLGGLLATRLAADGAKIVVHHHSDSSAEDVHAILDAMEAGDSDEVSERYEQLRDFWADYAARERRN